MVEGTTIPDSMLYRRIYPRSDIGQLPVHAMLEELCPGRIMLVSLPPRRRSRSLGREAQLSGQSMVSNGISEWIEADMS